MSLLFLLERLGFRKSGTSLTAIASTFRPRLAYETRYGYRFRDALRAELWWRVEHCGPSDYTTPLGAAFGYVRGVGYANRKAAEHRAQPFRGQN